MRPGSAPLMAAAVLAAAVAGTAAGSWLRSRPGNAPSPAEKAEWDHRHFPTSPEAVSETTETTGLRIEASDLDTAPDSHPVRVPPALRPRPGSDTLDRFADVAAAVVPTVVTVLSQRQLRGDENGIFQRFFGGEHPSVEGHGSGFILSGTGTILTNSHVVEDATVLSVRLADGREFDATVLGRDPHTDIALLRITTAGLPAARLGDSDRVRVGEWVLAVGSPFRASLGSTVTTGIVSGKGRDNVDITDYEDFLQTDAAVNPGNSGGPLVNLRGEVIGVNTAIATQNGAAQGVSFAIPINLARVIVERLLRDGRVTRAWLGIGIEPVASTLARSAGLPRPMGVRITEVLRQSPAARAGLRAEDIILALDGETLERAASFRTRISLRRPGQTVALEVLRRGERRTVHAVLAELPDDAAAATPSARPLP